MAESRDLHVQLLPKPALSPGTAASFHESTSGREPPRSVTCCSTLFTWVYPLLRKAVCVERLEAGDLFSLEPRAQPETVFNDFMNEWSRRVGRSRRPGHLQLSVLLRVHAPKVWHLCLGRIIQAILGFAFPLFLNLITKNVKQQNAPIAQGVGFATCYLVLSMISVILDNNLSMEEQSFGMRMKASLITAVFRKVIVLRQDSLRSFSRGKLSNLITTDVDKANEAVAYLHFLFTAPLSITISLISLYQLIGVAVFIGLAWLLFVVILAKILMRIAAKLEDKQQSKTDERVRIASEIIEGISVIKAYAWEEPITRKVEEARRAELLAIWRVNCLSTISDALWNSITPVVTAVTLSSYTLLNPHDPLTAVQAFTAIALLDILAEPLFTIPQVLHSIVQALVASKRMERLFLLPEVQLPVTANTCSFCPHARSNFVENRTGLDEGVVKFTGQTYAWPRMAQQGDENEQAEDEDGEGDEHMRPPSFFAQSVDSVAETSQESSFTLSDLKVVVPRGSLVAVVGATGSGKTSLLHAILGEMPPAPTSDDSEFLLAPASHAEPIAFASQQPWVFNGTIKENILLGSAFHETRYSECIEACDLEKDLSLLKHGDNTKIGEKGIALSGGQKARVCLARAAYRQGVSSLFVLDDPYSALDAHVARNIHNKVIIRMLAKKTRVVATNRLEFMSDCDVVVVLESGRIEAVGSFATVSRSSKALRRLMAAQALAQDGMRFGLLRRVCSTPRILCRKKPAQHLSPLSTQLGAQIGAKSHRLMELEEESDEEQEDAVSESDEEDAAESRASGIVNKDVFLYYLRHMGWCSVALLAFMYTFSEVIYLGGPIWMSIWTTRSPGLDDVGFYLTVYVTLSAAYVVSLVLRDLLGSLFAFRAARSLHRDMFARVLRAPMMFFQDTPQGRLINRFAKDMSEIDNDLIWVVIHLVVPLISLIGNFVLVGGIAYFALIVFLPAFWLYYQFWKLYNKAAIDLKRISKVSASPVYDHFNNLSRENAISIIRSHHQIQQECCRNNELVAEQQRPEYNIIYAEHWFGMYVETLGSVFVFLVMLFAVLDKGRDLSPGLAALAITFAGECSGSIELLIGQLAEFGMAFTCVERVMEYSTTLPSEASYVTDMLPPSGWPSAGALDVEDVRMRYQPGLDLVLKGISFKIKPGEHLGVVGRTGSGKSSLLRTILRIVEPEEGSKICLDGVDLLLLGLRHVRSNITMIPQEPVLFQESLRYNCDPFGHHDAGEVWKALEEAQLAPWVREQTAFSSSGPWSSMSTTTVADAELEDLLLLQISEAGQNLSAGQRQMVAIARGVLRKSKLVVLDEATAAMDAGTDAAVQAAVRRCFMGSSTLTIAHRLQTILDSDRVLVLAEGEVVEMDTPRELRQRRGGIFRSMVLEAGL